MRHDAVLEGAAFRLRPLTLDDAAFVVTLRTDPKLARFLNATSPSLADQRAWTERYFARQGDFNFIVERQADGKAEGVIALYNEEPRAEAEWGRWVLKPGSLAAPESALLIYRFGLDRRALSRVYCRTLADHHAVIQFHVSSGLDTVDVGAGQPYVEQQVTAQTWPQVAAVLEKGAERSATLLRRRGG